MEDDQATDTYVLDCLIARLYDAARQEDNHVVNLEKARKALNSTGGDVERAILFYHDVLGCEDVAPRKPEPLLQGAKQKDQKVASSPLDQQIPPDPPGAFTGESVVSAIAYPLAVSEPMGVDTNAETATTTLPTVDITETTTSTDEITGSATSIGAVRLDRTGEELAGQEEKRTPQEEIKYWLRLSRRQTFLLVFVLLMIVLSIVASLLAVRPLDELEQMKSMQEAPKLGASGISSQFNTEATVTPKAGPTFNANATANHAANLEPNSKPHDTPNPSSNPQTYATTNTKANTAPHATANAPSTASSKAPKTPSSTVPQ